MKKTLYILAITTLVFTTSPAHAGFMDFLRDFFVTPEGEAPADPIAPPVIDAPVVDRKTLIRAPRVAPIDSLERDNLVTPPSPPEAPESDQADGGGEPSVDALSPEQTWAETFPLCSFKPASSSSSCYLKDYCHCSNFIPPASGPVGEIITDATPRYRWTVVGQGCDEAIPAESQPLIGLSSARASNAGPLGGVLGSNADDPLQINIQRLGRTFQEACTAGHGTTSERSSDCELGTVNCPFLAPIKCRVPQGVSMRANQLSLSPLITYDYDGTAGGAPRVIDTYSETSFVIGGMVILNDNPELVSCLAPHLSPALSMRDRMTAAPYLNPAADPRRGSSYLEALAW